MFIKRRELGDAVGGLAGFVVLKKEMGRVNVGRFEGWGSL